MKIGKESAEAVHVDRESVASLADKHGKDVMFDHRRGRFFALPGALADDEETRFYVGGWYVERDGRNPGVDDRRGIPGREGVEGCPTAHFVA